MATATSSDPKERHRSLMARAQAAYEDLSFTHVREWKERNPGSAAVGILPIYAPREVIHAAGALPAGIFGGADLLEVVRGDSYFQSYICRLPRSVIELAVSGRLDAMDGFIFPSICDVVRNLSGMFKLLFSGKFVHYLDLPQNYSLRLGGRFYREEIGAIARGVGALTGRAVTDDALFRSIETYNGNRRALARLAALRTSCPWQVPVVEYYLLLRAGGVLPVEDHTAMVEEYLHLTPELGRPAMDNIRVLVRGTFCEQPPLGLLTTLERAGCYVVDDDLALGMHFIPEPFDPGNDPIGSLVDAFISRSLPTASKYDQNRTKGADLIARIREVKADGVVLMAPSFCDPALLDQPMLQKALDAAGVPYTALKYSEDTGQFQVIREQAGAFADAIKLWGTV